MDDIHTTAKWANRMLRPLTSLHHRLGKYRETQSIDEKQHEIIKTAPANLVPESSKRNATGDSERDSDCGDHDPSWIPQKPATKRVKHKYAAKGEQVRGRRRIRAAIHSPETVRTLPGAIEIATPLITGKLTDVTDQGNKQTVFGDHQDAHNSRHVTQSLEHEGLAEKAGRRQRQARFPKQDAQWRVSLDSAKDTNYVDIVQRLDMLFLKFLEKTRLAGSRSPRSTSNSRSLLLMVMRQLPQFIAEEQKRQDELDEDDDIDMADAYFTELESAYGSSGKGWQPLREAVRSQGIFLVCDMLRKNWITHLTASILINKCIGAEENDAVERLLSVLLLKLDRCAFPDAFDPWRVHQSVRDPIRLLHKYWTVSGNNSFVFREIRQLLQRKVLPVEWMVTTPWKAFVASATKSLSSGDNEYAAATELIAAILETAADTYPGERSQNNQHAKTAKRKHVQSASVAQTGGSQSDRNRCPVYIHDALSNLTSSLVVALCSMYCVRMEQPTNLDLDSGARIVSTFSRMGLAIQRDLAIKKGMLEDDQIKAHLFRKGCVLLGHYLLKCQQDAQILDCAKEDTLDVVLSKDCEGIFQLLEKNPDIIKELSGMVGQVVRCCERGGEQAQCRRARRLCSHLLAFEQFGLNSLTLFLGRVAVEVALEFAQCSQDAEDHTFAAEIQETVSARRIRLGDNGGKTPRPGNHNNTLFFRWEEGIGEWIAKTPLMKSKSTMSRPMVEIQTRARSPSSVSEEASISPSSVSHESSITSVESPSSISLKRKNMDVEPPRQRIKRSRRSYDKTRQSARIATKQSNVLVVIHAGERNHSPGDYDDDYRVLDTGPDSEEERAEDVEAETGEISDDEEDAKFLELRGSVAKHQQQHQKRSMNFEVVIHKYAAAPRQTLERGHGPPRKQVAQRARAAVPPRLILPQRRSVIPCSEDGEESDDELSFL